ncbi:hypothetical protein CAOG_09110 [Capsaspora owczarzaki ATCC 30864]|uniref:hypothetical protein n=1 Tax=Capsaspora owczarzaki (strain ATCC 30864) TaxID=595528 RepID=UPI0003526B58|nr:hypothetical protein CAOG_09110 [Capsaspora owczarzaki ATCC 30864]|eukprot:XP_011270767.1 hypothetical protein CAOG_09110 [Capsaspora owczarzaki ATCC 30864]
MTLHQPRFFYLRRTKKTLPPQHVPDRLCSDITEPPFAHGGGDFGSCLRLSGLNLLHDVYSGSRKNLGRTSRSRRILRPAPRRVAYMDCTHCVPKETELVGDLAVGEAGFVQLQLVRPNDLPTRLDDSGLRRRWWGYITACDSLHERRRRGRGTSRTSHGGVELWK